MTIIEAALEKTKALRGHRPEPLNPPGGVQHDYSRRAADRAPADRANDTIPAAVAPSTQIQPHRVAFDPETARENRLLLSASLPEDHGTIAAYGMLRTRILHRTRANNWRTVGLTSAAPQDGKSLTAVNLALSLAREKNSSVVLLDLDMRNPSVCRTLGITPPTELRDFFEGRVDTPEDLFMSIGIDNLLVAGNVTATDNSAELLASAKLEELLDFIRRTTTNPLILIDLPPVLSPDDTLVVAPRIDSLVLVACEGKTPRADIQRAGELLADFPIVGLVLNRSSESVQGYGYGYGYGQGTRSGHT
jgi:capsular exopolysaccharide synthesis family protein